VCSPREPRLWCASNHIQAPCSPGASADLSSSPAPGVLAARVPLTDECRSPARQLTSRRHLPPCVLSARLPLTGECRSPLRTLALCAQRSKGFEISVLWNSRVRAMRSSVGRPRDAAAWRAGRGAPGARACKPAGRMPRVRAPPPGRCVRAVPCVPRAHGALAEMPVLTNRRAASLPARAPRHAAPRVHPAQVYKTFKSFKISPQDLSERAKTKRVATRPHGVRSAGEMCGDDAPLASKQGAGRDAPDASCGGCTRCSAGRAMRDRGRARSRCWVAAAALAEMLVARAVISWSSVLLCGGVGVPWRSALGVDFPSCASRRIVRWLYQVQRGACAMRNRGRARSRCSGALAEMPLRLIIILSPLSPVCMPLHMHLSCVSAFTLPHVRTQVTEILKHDPSQVNVVDGSVCTCLHLAAEKGHLIVVSLGLIGPSSAPCTRAASLGVLRSAASSRRAARALLLAFCCLPVLPLGRQQRNKCNETRAQYAD